MMYKIIDNKVLKRLEDWKKLRKDLETSENPLDDVVNFFLNLPEVKLYTDPYDETTWPSPWELIEENQYCRFNIILGIFYTLKLSNRFSNSKFKITVTIDKNSNSVYYLLFYKDLVYGFEDTVWISTTLLPKSLKHIKIYDPNGLL